MSGRLRVGLVAAALVAALVVCGFGLHARDSASRESADRASVAAQAAASVAAVFSVADDTWRADRDRARAHLAEPLATALRPALATGPPAGVASVVWTPTARAVVDVDGRSATALIVADVAVTPTSGAVRTGSQTVQASMRNIDGHWRLAGLDVLRDEQ